MAAPQQNFDGFTSSLVQKLDGELICGVCLEFFKTPRLLPCGHNFCQECLIQMIQNGSSFSFISIGPATSFNCPVCQAVVNYAGGNIDHLPVNRALESIVGMYQECSPVNIFDGSWNATMSIVPGKCKEHGLDEDMYCESCNETACKKCVKLRHTGRGKAKHSIEPLVQCATNYQAKISDTLTELKKKMIPLSDKINVLEEMLSGIKANEENIMKKLDQQISSLMATLRAQHEELKRQLTNENLVTQRPVQEELDKCQAVKINTLELMKKLSTIRKTEDIKLKLQFMKDTSTQLNTMLCNDIRWCLESSRLPQVDMPSWNLETQLLVDTMSQLAWKHKEFKETRSFSTQTSETLYTDSHPTANKLQAFESPRIAEPVKLQPIKTNGVPDVHSQPFRLPDTPTPTSKIPPKKKDKNIRPGLKTVPRTSLETSSSEPVREQTNSQRNVQVGSQTNSTQNVQVSEQTNSARSAQVSPGSVHVSPGSVHVSPRSVKVGTSAELLASQERSATSMGQSQGNRLVARSGNEDGPRMRTSPVEMKLKEQKRVTRDGKTGAGEDELFERQVPLKSNDSKTLDALVWSDSEEDIEFGQNVETEQVKDVRVKTVGKTPIREVRSTTERETDFIGDDDLENGFRGLQVTEKLHRIKGRSSFPLDSTRSESENSKARGSSRQRLELPNENLNRSYSRTPPRSKNAEALAKFMARRRTISPSTSAPGSLLHLSPNTKPRGTGSKQDIRKGTQDLVNGTFDRDTACKNRVATVDDDDDDDNDDSNTSEESGSEIHDNVGALSGGNNIVVMVTQNKTKSQCNQQRQPLNAASGLENRFGDRQTSSQRNSVEADGDAANKHRSEGASGQSESRKNQPSSKQYSKLPLGINLDFDLGPPVEMEPATDRKGGRVVTEV